MNPNNLDQHQINLNEFVESKQIGIFFYLSPKAGFYYIIYRGKKRLLLVKCLLFTLLAAI